MAQVRASWPTSNGALGIAAEVTPPFVPPVPHVTANWPTAGNCIGFAIEIKFDPGGPPPASEVDASWPTSENALGLAGEIKTGSVLPPGTQVEASWSSAENAIAFALEIQPGDTAPREVGASWPTPENALGIAFEVSQFFEPPPPPPPPISGISISDIRVALASTLGAIRGFQVSPWVLSKPTPPTIQIRPGAIDYDKAFNRGLDFVVMTVQAFVAINDMQASQRRLDELLAPQGPNSVKNALESDRQLGGIVEDLHVTSCTGYGEFTRADGSAVLGAEWEVLIYASGL